MSDQQEQAAQWPPQQQFQQPPYYQPQRDQQKLYNSPAVQNTPLPQHQSQQSYYLPQGPGQFPTEWLPSLTTSTSVESVK